MMIAEFFFFQDNQMLVKLSHTELFCFTQGALIDTT